MSTLRTERESLVESGNLHEQEVDGTSIKIEQVHRDRQKRKRATNISKEEELAVKQNKDTQQQNNGMENVALMEAISELDTRVAKATEKWKDNKMMKRNANVGTAAVVASHQLNAPLVDLGMANKLKCIERIEKAKLKEIRRVPRVRETFRFQKGSGQATGVSKGKDEQSWFNGDLKA